MTLTLPALPVLRRRTRPVTVPQAVQQAAPTQLALSANALHGNLLAADSGTWAYFLLEPQRWAFLSGLPAPADPGDKGALLDRIALRVTDLVGHRIHLRSTSHPLPYSVWARLLHASSPNRLPDTDEPGAETWEDYLVAGQDLLKQRRSDRPATYLGVRLTTKQLTHEELKTLRNATVLAGDDVEKLRATLRKVTGAVRKAGMGGRPVSERGLAWLLHTSIGLGIPIDEGTLASPQGGWGPDDMRTFTGSVYAAAGPYSETVRIRALRGGRPHEKHLAMLTVDTFGDRDPLNPGLWPWAAATQTLPFDTQWSMTFDVNSGQDQARAAEIVRQRAEALDEHYREHNMTPPHAVDRAIQDARRIEDEVQNGPREVSCRIVGPVRLAVIGDTAQQALDHAQTTIAHFAEHQKITLAHEYGQFAMYREFWPGESPELQAFTHVMRVDWLAAALPHATMALGDQVGPILGSTGRSAVMFDPTWGPEHNLSGLIFMLGGLGAGKTTLFAILAEGMVRRGRQTLLHDGSGGLARLCDMPHLRRHARAFEITGAAPGSLIPYRQVPDPLMHHYPTEKAWRSACINANAERRDLMVDTILLLIDDRLRHADGAQSLVEDCVNLTGGDYATDPWAVVDRLRQHGGVGTVIAERLETAAQMSGGALMFPERGEVDPDVTSELDSMLTVVTMRGLAVPPAGRPPQTRQERMAVPVLNLCARQAAKQMYASQEAKFIGVSEASILTDQDNSFRALMDRVSLESRKTRTAFAIDTQNPSHALKIAPEIVNLVGAAFAGRMPSGKAAQAALEFLNVPQGHGYERALTDLEPGQFIGRFYDGAVGPLQVERDYRPVMAQALDTTPERTAAAASFGAWAVEA